MQCIGKWKQHFICIKNRFNVLAWLPVEMNNYITESKVHKNLKTTTIKKSKFYNNKIYLLQSHTTPFKEKQTLLQYISTRATHNTVIKYIERWAIGILLSLSWRHSWNEEEISSKKVN